MWKIYLHCKSGEWTCSSQLQQFHSFGRMTLNKEFFSAPPFYKSYLDQTPDKLDSISVSSLYNGLYINFLLCFVPCSDPPEEEVGCWLSEVLESCQIKINSKELMTELERWSMNTWEDKRIYSRLFSKKYMFSDRKLDHMINAGKVSTGWRPQVTGWTTLGKQDWGEHGRMKRICIGKRE